MSFLFGGSNFNLFSSIEAPEVPTASVIGTPYNVHHKVHVDFDLKWHGQEPTELFEIYEKLGEGGYGAVYRARHKETGFTLAIKMIDLADEAEKIMHEIDILKKCRNPCIVSYYGSVVNEKKLWILMDYCSLGSIADVLTECPPLSEDQIAHVCTEVLKGLAYLHASKIIHRDVKAANILLTNQAHVRIVDFGISAQIDKSEKLHEPVGSPYWMAPEVIMETEHSYKCDIWSLGITALEMAEGAPPHSNIHPFRALFLIPKKPPPTFSDPSKWSKEANDFVNQCLQKQPHERPSAMELLQHPFIAKKTQGSEVLRSTIITYLKAKKEKQMKLKREIAKLGKRPTGELQDDPASSSLSPSPSPRLPSPSPSPVPPLPLSGAAPLLPDIEFIPNSELLDSARSNGTAATDIDSVDLSVTSQPEYQTMFIMGSLNAADMPNVDPSLDLDGGHPSDTMHVDQNSEKPKNSKNSKTATQSRYSINASEFQILRQMICDAKIEICRVREEVSVQNTVFKSELSDIKSKLNELTTLMLAMNANQSSFSSSSQPVSPSPSLPNPAQLKRKPTEAVAKK